MNKKGQTLILFVIFIPVLLGLCALIIDVSLVILENIRLKEVSKMIIEDVFEEASSEKIEELYIANDIPISKLKTQVNDNYVLVENEYEIDSIFGSVIGLDKYKIKVEIKGIKEDNKLIFE